MTWSDSLREAEERLRREDARGAALAAFGALEACYVVAAREKGWQPPSRTDDRFGAALEFLAHQGRAIRADEYVLAKHLASARNVMTHKYGFEPSLKEAHKTLEWVRRLCGRFGTTVADVMTKPVVTAAPAQPVGELVMHMVDDGISQFPVVEGGRMVGTLVDSHVLTAYEAGEGILDPQTPVRDLMDAELLPGIAPNAGLDEARRRLRDAKHGALLVLTKGLPTGIVTKYDLLRHLEL